MNPENQRIAIAEACGWKEIRAEVDWLPEELTGIFTWPHPTDAEKTKYFISRKPVPNYLYDLNAMHEAEKFILSTDLYIQYVNYLFRSVGLNRTYYMGATPEVFPADRQFAVFHATASQRAEAFIRTIGKWEDAK